MATIVELPRLSDTMEEGVIAKWHIAEGDKVKRGQVIAEIETDKATMEFESFDAGIVLKLVAPEGETLPLGAPIAVLGDPGEDPTGVLSSHGGAPSGPSASAPAPAPVAAESATSGSNGDGRIPASPVARRLAREHDLSIASISGSGPHGRVVKTDVEAAIASKGDGRPPAAPTPAAPATEPAGTAEPSSTVDHEGRPFISRPDETVRLTQMRKAIARRMTQSKQPIPHYYLTIEIDMDRAAKLRAEFNEAVSGTKVSYNDIIILGVAKALRQHPEINASFENDNVVRRGDIHIGVAVAVSDGLIVPVIKFADQKSLKAISIEMRDLGKRAKKKQLKPAEITGSTFTVSNLGMYGLSHFTAVINPGEGAILAVAAIQDMVVPHEGEIAVRKRMKVSFSGDHRANDGAQGARFLVTLKKLLEQPMSLFT